jgi:6-phosphofructokinase
LKKTAGSRLVYSGNLNIEMGNKMSKNTRSVPQGNMIIGQSGGPTVVINQSLVGAVLAARGRKNNIRKVYGARHGVSGVLNQDFIDLSGIGIKELEQISFTPSAALGSVRKKPTPEECMEMFNIMRAHDVRFFFYIGGNDSAETAHIIHTVAVDESYDLRVFHIPKTIDNDLRGTDHSPGFGSAARFVAQAFMGDDMDNRSLKGIKINVVMGRNAGFLTAASCLGRTDRDSGPHLVYVPEIPFSERQFVRDIKKVFAEHGRCLVAVSEGIAGRDGRTLAEKFSTDVDSHGNKQLSGSGALGDYLAGLVKKGFGRKQVRVRADTFGYLQRSFAGLWSETDAAEARKVGELAVEAATSGHASGTISMIRLKGKPYRIRYKVSPLSTVARHTMELPRKYINRDGNNVTRAFIEYALPLAGELPRCGLLAGKIIRPVKI